MSRKLESLPLGGKIVRDLNKKSKKLGYQKTMQEILKLTRTKFEVVHKGSLVKSLLKKGPMIVVSNHPALTDAITLVAAEEPREDAYLVISSNFLGMLSNLDKHLIPVYINHRLLSKEDPLSGLINLFKKIHWTKNYSSKISHQKNINSIKKAGNIVKNGGMVSMFPGGGGKKREWFSGIGYLINDAFGNKKTKIVMAYSEGTSPWDLIRIIPGGSLFLPKCKVTFSPDESILNYGSMNPKEITESLKNKYNLWVESLPKQIGWWRRIVNKLPAVPENAYYLTRCLVLWVMTRTMS